MAIERSEWEMQNLQTEIWCFVCTMKYYLWMWEEEKNMPNSVETTKILAVIFKRSFVFK